MKPAMKSKPVGILAGLVCGALALVAGPVHATFGGPTEVELLGCDLQAHRVYFTRTRHDESGASPRVFYIAWADSLGRPGAGKPVPLWADVSASADSGRAGDPASQELAHRIQALRGTLLGLFPSNGDVAGVQVTATAQDSTPPKAWDPPRARYRLHVEIAQDGYTGSTDVMAYCRPGGRVINWLRVPEMMPAAGRRSRPPTTSARIAVFAYTGDPNETCYEVQDVILLTKRAPRKTPPR